MKFKDFEPWQWKKLLLSLLIILFVGITYIGYGSYVLYNDKIGEADYWNSGLQTKPGLLERASEFGTNATPVEVGTYVTNLKEVSLKTSSFRLVTYIWFRWEGNNDLDMINHFIVYKGTMNKMEILEDYHEGNTNYQLARIDVTITKNFWTRRYPLESHQLRMYIESTRSIDHVQFIPDKENSSINENLSIGGYEITHYDTSSILYEANSDYNNPEFEGNFISPEHVTAIEINRNGFGLYIKCFIALVGTITWVFLTLFICAYHRVDPLAMIPAALFGTVTNIMVGANILPDALEFGLLELTNLFGVMIIMAISIVIININRSRTLHKDNNFAYLYGRIMFYVLLALTFIGNIAFPLAAYIF